jgi:peptidyl-prolyl cis-trans isomerase D
MLDAIRNRTKSWVVKGFMILLALSFAVWGIGDMFRGSQDPAVAEAGSASIRVSALQNQYRRSLASFRQMTGGQLTDEQARDFGLLDQAIETLVVRALMAQETHAIGIGVSDDSVRDSITNSQSFRNEAGLFDRMLYEAALRENGYNEQSYVATLREDLASAQVIGSLTGGLATPKAVTDLLHAHRGERRRAAVATIMPETMTDIAEPTDGDLQTYYAANEAQFMAQELRRVAFLSLRPADLLDEIEVADADIRASYDARLDQITIPHRRDIDMFVLADEEAAQAARRRVEEGEDFLAVGSDITGNSEDDMRLGVIEDGDLLPEIAEAIFSAPVDGVALPFQSAFGWHLVRVNEDMPGGAPSFEELAEEIRFELKIEEAADATWALSGRLEDERASGASLEEAGRALGMTAVSLGPLDRYGRDGEEKAIEDMPPIAEFLDNVFLAREGDESDLIEAPGNIFYVFRVDSIQPTAVKPLAAVREQVADAWRTERREEAAVAKAAALADAAISAGGLAAAAAEMAIETMETAAFTREGRDMDPGLTGAVADAVFALRDGETSGPIATSGGTQVVAELIEVIAADDMDMAAKEAIAGRIAEAYRIDVLDGYDAFLRREYGVSVDRALIDTIY